MQSIEPDVTIEQIAAAVLNDDALALRALVQTFLRGQPVLAELSQPETDNPVVLAVVAALLELFSSRTQQPAPGWTRQVGPLEQPIYESSEKTEFFSKIAGFPRCESALKTRFLGLFAVDPSIC